MSVLGALFIRTSSLLQASHKAFAEHPGVIAAALEAVCSRLQPEKVGSFSAPEIMPWV